MTKPASPETPTGNCVIIRQVWDRVEVFDGSEIYLGSHDTHAEAVAAARADAESEGVPFVDLSASEAAPTHHHPATTPTGSLLSPAQQDIENG